MSRFEVITRATMTELISALNELNETEFFTIANIVVYGTVCAAIIDKQVPVTAFAEFDEEEVTEYNNNTNQLKGMA